MFSEASVSHFAHRQGGLPSGGGVCLQGLCIWGSSSILVCLPGSLHPQAGLPMRGVCLQEVCIEGVCVQECSASFEGLHPRVLPTSRDLNPWGSRVYILL